MGARCEDLFTHFFHLIVLPHLTQVKVTFKMIFSCDLGAFLAHFCFVIWVNLNAFLA